jgi:hypothetical protein
MLTLHELERHYSYLDPALLEIVLELRNLVAELAPQATERLIRNSLSYYDASRGGPVSAGICGMDIERDHIRLYFALGAFLPDPTGLLRSDPGRLAMRFTIIRSYNSAPWDDLRNLMFAASRLDLHSMTNEEINKFLNRPNKTP